MNWDNIRIKNVRPYKSDYRLPKKDKCTVELDMLLEDYGEFRKMIEAHHIHNRRRDDQ